MPRMLHLCLGAVFSQVIVYHRTLFTAGPVPKVLEMVTNVLLFL